MRNNVKTIRESAGAGSPERVAPAAAETYGDFSLRFAAVLIDSTVLLVLNGIFQSAVFGSAAPGLWLNIFISIAVACSYETFFIGKMAATPGKMALGLKVMRPDGSPMGYGRAAGRYFAKILSTITFGIGYIMAGFDYRNRALHDMVCDTLVIGAEVQQLCAYFPKKGLGIHIVPVE